MNTNELIVAMTEHLAWPITVLIVIYLLRAPLKATLSRVAKLKHGETEVTFSEISKKIITQEPSKEEKKNLTSHQIIYENENSRLYSNGILVHRFKITISAGEISKRIVYPLAFPNEPLSIEFVGPINARVIELNQGNFTFEYEPIEKDCEVELVISGL